MNQFGNGNLISSNTNIAVLISDCKFDEVSKIVDFCKSSFQKVKSIDFCYLPDYKKYKKPDDIPTFDGVFTFHPKKDLNMFGVIKNKDFKEKFLFKKHTILLCSCLKNHKYVNKLIYRKNTDLTVGVENESLPNFAMSFLVESNNHIDFLKLAKKYLEK